MGGIGHYVHGYWPQMDLFFGYNKFYIINSNFNNYYVHGWQWATGPNGLDKVSL